MLTFLFTDIEGSTRLWESDPAAMEAALTQHDVLLRSIIEGGGGQVFKTIGDAFCAVFDSAPDAVAAAVKAQSALRASAWVGHVELRVRMGLHTGECAPRDGDYFGPTVNRAARIQAIAHGGQVVMSAATATQIHIGLVAGVSIRDLGVHRLKDLGQPEQIFQVDPDGAPADFPPLRSLNNPALRHNLPLQVSSFVGRTEELEALTDLLENHRLVTLTGAGGCGKTRLALQAAADLLDGSADGVWLVELAPLSDPDAVARLVANVLGVREEAGRPLVDSLSVALRERRLLLILDNCEHLLDAAAKLTDALLRSCPNISVLATTREPLRIGGERVHRIPSLGVPAIGMSTELLAGFEAVRLFTERATSHVAEFALDESNADTVAAICRHLDGIPLAIELAAARLPSMPLKTIEARLDDRFRLLNIGIRTALPRHQTLLSLVEWSFELLNDPERLVLAGASVFAGGFTLAAAQAVCGTGDEADWQVADLLGSLVDKSLVQADPSGATIRFRLLETIRHYAAEQLGHRLDGERSAADAHAGFYLDLAENGTNLIGPERGSWIEVLKIEHDNLRAAFNHALTGWRGSQGALEFAVALFRFWETGGFLSEGVQLTEAALSQNRDDQSPRSRAAALLVAARLRQQFGDNAIAIAHLEEGLRLTADISAPAITADLLSHRSFLHLLQGHLDEAMIAADQAVEYAHKSGDERTLVSSLNCQAISLSATKPDSAHVVFTEIIARLEEVGERAELGRAFHDLGYLELEQGELRVAGDHLETALEIAEEVHDYGAIPHCWLSLGLVALSDREYPTAREAFAKVISFARHVGAAPLLANAVLGAALSLDGDRDEKRAIVLHGGAAALLESLDELLAPVVARLRDTDHQRLRDLVGEAEFQAAFESGYALTPDEVIQLALADSN